jgi:hypothetical protein
MDVGPEPSNRIGHRKFKTRARRTHAERLSFCFMDVGPKSSISVGSTEQRREPALNGRLLVNSFELLIDDLTREPINRDVQPISLLALNDKL